MEPISIIAEINHIAKVRGLIEEWRQLKKSKGRDGDTRQRAREALVDILDKLWNIGSPNVIA